MINIVDMQITKNFKLSEFICSHCGNVIIDFISIDMLQKARDIFEDAIIVAVGTRCQVHNNNVGGDPNSLHLKGLAYDVKPTNNKTVYDLARALYRAGFNGIGISDNKNSKPIAGYYVHAQRGSNATFWVYDKYNKRVSITKDAFLKMIGM